MPTFSNLPTNILKNVETYQQTQIAWLLLNYPLINRANRHFEEMATFGGQLGNTVTFRREPQMLLTKGSIAPNFQPVNQDFLTISVDIQGNVSWAMDPFEQYFNMSSNDYMQQVEKSAVLEFAPDIEKNLGEQFDKCFRFYGDGVTNITTGQQLAQIISYFRDFGSSKINVFGILPDDLYAQIISSQLNQFALDRNNDLSDYDWGEGRLRQCDWLSSHLLPIHISGSIGIAGEELTVVSTNSPDGSNITQITCTGNIGTDPNAIKQYDKLYFQDGVSGFQNLRYLQYHGHQVTATNVVTMAAAADAASSAGTITFTITHPLCSASGIVRQNINGAIQAGMKITVLPSYRYGAISSGDSLYLAMPNPQKWLKTDPYKYSIHMDEESGISLGMWNGWLPEKSVNGTCMPYTYGTTIEPLNTMQIILPLV